jgi:hypothetical protein
MTIPSFVYGHLDDAKGRPVGVDPRQERQGHVVDWHAALRPTLGTATMRVTVKDEGHRKLTNRFFESARSDEGIDLQGFAVYGFLDR